jgi:UDP-N-acetylmuramate dehydrogenase
VSERQARVVPRLDAVAAALESRLPGRVRRDVPSADLTTYRVGGPIGVLVRASSEDDVVAAAAALREHDATPVLVVGRGSNLLVADRGFEGVGLLLDGAFESIVVDRDTARVHAGASVALPVLARQAAAEGIGELEFLVGIPGSVGGAVRMNAGGHGRETRDVLVSARVVDLGTGAVGDRACEDLALGYRRSALGATDVVLGAVLQGTHDSREAAEARIGEIVRWRREHQPGGANAGSVFTNPEGDSAGRIIDDCGLKGLRVGGAVVSEKHANFIQAEPGATAADVAALVAEVRRRVADARGVQLRPELRLVGFEDGDQGESGRA